MEDSYDQILADDFRVMLWMTGIVAGVMAVDLGLACTKGCSTAWRRLLVALASMNLPPLLMLFATHEYRDESFWILVHWSLLLFTAVGLLAWASMEAFVRKVRVLIVSHQQGKTRPCWLDVVFFLSATVMAVAIFSLVYWNLSFPECQYYSNGGCDFNPPTLVALGLALFGVPLCLLLLAAVVVGVQRFRHSDN